MHKQLRSTYNSNENKWLKYITLEMLNKIKPVYFPGDHFLKNTIKSSVSAHCH